jgi:hypothetical protein
MCLEKDSKPITINYIYMVRSCIREWLMSYFKDNYQFKILNLKNYLPSNLEVDWMIEVWRNFFFFFQVTRGQEEGRDKSVTHQTEEKQKKQKQKIDEMPF